MFSTYDSHMELYGYEPLIVTSDGIQKVCQLESFQKRALLPNWVGPAKDTTLAKLAKKGFIYTPMFQGYMDPLDGNHVQDNGANMFRNLKRSVGRGDHGRSHYSRSGVTRLKDCRELKGKLIGVEVEFYPDDPERLARRNRSPFVSVDTDGSLQDCGREVRRIAWVQDNRVRGIARMRLDGEVSRKCGLHVHVDVRDLDDGAVNSIIDKLKCCYNYLRWMVPSNRRSSYRWVEWQLASDGHFAAVNRNYNHGTIEFRMQQSSLNTCFIENWALFCYHLVRSLRHRDSPPTWPKFVALFPRQLREWIIKVPIYMETDQDFDDEAVDAFPGGVESDDYFSGRSTMEDDDDED